jgi:hypothetical protein
MMLTLTKGEAMAIIKMAQHLDNQHVPWDLLRRIDKLWPDVVPDYLHQWDVEA